MNIVITGATGLIGSALSTALVQAGHTVYGMERSRHSSQPFHWLPAEGYIHFDESIQVDAVVHLAGAGIADQRWDEARKRIIKNSRVDATRLLAAKLAELPHKPKVFVSGSAIGYYGETGDRQVDESGRPGGDYLADVSIDWEKASQAAKESGIRTVIIRTGVVLSDHGGALQQMLLPFKLGAGGVVGNGRQYMSWVSLRDAISMIRFAIDHADISGPVNLVAPNAVTNREFTKTLGKVLKRPTILPMPAAAARMAFGEMADHLLLSSIRVYPALLEKAGYQFQDAELEGALRFILNKQ